MSCQLPRPPPTLSEGDASIDPMRSPSGEPVEPLVHEPPVVTQRLA
jgi:hypothetical protein